MIALFPSRTVAFSVFGFGVHWYGLMYLLAFICGYILIQRLQKYRGIAWTSDEWGSLATWVILGVIVGARLGFVLFWAPSYFLRHPLEVFQVWNGGMSSHGGFLAVIILTLWYARRHRMDWFALGDLLVIVTAIGLALGRFGNFINQEIYGTVTTLPWGMTFDGAEGARHPTQLYAVAKNLFIAAVCYAHLRTARPAVPGRTGAIFLMLYGVLRFLKEYLLAQDTPPVDVGFIVLTRGQVLTIPIFLGGVFVWWYAGRRARVGADS